MNFSPSKEVKWKKIFSESFNFLLSLFQWILELKSLDLRICYAYFEQNKSLEEAHRLKVAKSLVYAILEENPDKK